MSLLTCSQPMDSLGSSPLCRLTGPPWHPVGVLCEPVTSGEAKPHRGLFLEQAAKEAGDFWLSPPSRLQRPGDNIWPPSL